MKANLLTPATTPQSGETAQSSHVNADQVLVHQFIRLFGRRPTAEELARYQYARTGIGVRQPSNVRVRLAQLVTRL